MPLYFGIDTSNYTTSTALFCTGSGEVLQQKMLLPVPEGSLGLRQNDAVFLHVKQLGPLVEMLLSGSPAPVSVGVSLRPRDEEGSYMPCFLAGDMAARSISASLNIPRYEFSHQAGHVAAALYGAGRLSLMREKFLAFHISGGTTQCLLIQPDDEHIICISTIAETLDLHAGQVVDRVGAMLGLPFPAGPALEQLAGQSNRSFSTKVVLKDGNCCLSGAENQCRKMLDEGGHPEDIAAYCLAFVGNAVLGMTRYATRLHVDLPLIYAGGVMSNKQIRGMITSEYPDAGFALPAFSADNAAGTAILCALRHDKEFRL